MFLTYLSTQLVLCVNHVTSSKLTHRSLNAGLILSFSLGLTRLTGEMYPLSHGKSPSSMLLISSNNATFAYFGDSN
jgi:cAMP phosphodiesterase